MHAAQLIIRPYQAADQEAVVTLWRACGLVVPWNDPYQDIGFGFILCWWLGPVRRTGSPSFLAADHTQNTVK